MNLQILRAEVFMNTGAEYPVIDHYLLRGAIDFFTRSEAWQVTNQVSISAGEQNFNVPDVATGEFFKLVAIEIGDKVLERDALRKFCTVTEGGVVWLDKPAEGDTTMQVTAVYVPADNATAINDDIGRQYRDAFVNAALSKLFLIPKKPWTDTALAEYHRVKWEGKADIAKRHAYQGKQNQPTRTKCHFFSGR